MTGPAHYRRTAVVDASLTGLEPPAAVRVAEAALARAEAAARVAPHDAGLARRAAEAQRTLKNAREAWSVDLIDVLTPLRAEAAAGIVGGVERIQAGAAALRAIADFCRRHGLPVLQPWIPIPDLGETERAARHAARLRRRREGSS
ncbi:hypothetical protein FHP25_13330 [Vineibacter terrae]|uniref:Uncharacterized protein n=1 Tax=Vineibacter terrae TaxID=2586908 RepID=A0A5C8PNM6_9HYPH|nr:hypothetical protein [Vineibacter terrae]TXL75631.1 hypothetical protein FHP25_13330 [Vineibacter terrae]